jgi:hypothetical protein
MYEVSESSHKHSEDHKACNQHQAQARVGLPELEQLRGLGVLIAVLSGRAGLLWQLTLGSPQWNDRQRHGIVEQSGLATPELARVGQMQIRGHPCVDISMVRGAIVAVAACPMCHSAPG